MSDYKSKYNFLLFIFIVINITCTNAPNFSDVPLIEFTSVSKQTMEQSFFLTDSVIVAIQFEDGDGDLGHESSDPTLNIIVIDNRTGEIFDRFKSPFIPLQGVNNGIQGEIRLKIFTTCCTMPGGCESDDSFPEEQLSFDIYIVDRAGNQSNTITTSEITLLCT